MGFHAAVTKVRERLGVDQLTAAELVTQIDEVPGTPEDKAKAVTEATGVSVDDVLVMMVENELEPAEKPQDTVEW
jgi:hypothetical protein